MKFAIFQKVCSNRYVVVFDNFRLILDMSALLALTQLNQLIFFNAIVSFLLPPFTFHYSGRLTPSCTTPYVQAIRITSPTSITITLTLIHLLSRAAVSTTRYLANIGLRPPSSHPVTLNACAEQTEPRGGVNFTRRILSSGKH